MRKFYKPDFSKTKAGKLQKAAEVIPIPPAFRVYMENLPTKAVFLAQMCPRLEMHRDFHVYLVLSCFQTFRKSDLYGYGIYRHKDWWDKEKAKGFIEKFDNNSHSVYALTPIANEWIEGEINKAEQLWKDHFLKPSIKNSRRILTI